MMKVRFVLTSIFILLSIVGNQHALSQTPIDPIPNPTPPADQQFYFGRPAIANPLMSNRIPEHPFMGVEQQHNIHNDSYMSDVYQFAGPLGINPIVDSMALGGVCATITFDELGRLITACLNLSEANLFVIDPQTKTILDQRPLPYRQIQLSDLEFPAGTYFYLDQQNRIIIPVVGNLIWRLGIDDNHQFFEDTIFDLTQYVPDGDEINAVLPDYTGLLWFTTKAGIIGTLNIDTQTVQTLPLSNEQIGNSFAVDETNGVFIVTDTALYRFEADSNQAPTIVWRELYDRGNERKPGQVLQGSGTTPTLMGSDYVVITDNAEPQMQVLVYQRTATENDNRLVCAVPVFAEGRSATENSVIATDTSIIVENNYGYVPLQMAAGILSEVGLTRIDVIDGNCNVIWESAERIPTAVTKLSLATGLIYTYTRDEGNIETAPWIFTAINYHTGETVWEQYVGTGPDFNNNYAAIYLTPDGIAYVGVTNGIVSIRDGQ